MLARRRRQGARQQRKSAARRSTSVTSEPEVEQSSKGRAVGVHLHSDRRAGAGGSQCGDGLMERAGQGDARRAGVVGWRTSGGAWLCRQPVRAASPAHHASAHATCTQHLNKDKPQAHRLVGNQGHPQSHGGTPQPQLRAGEGSQAAGVTRASHGRVKTGEEERHGGQTGIASVPSAGRGTAATAAHGPVPHPLYGLHPARPHLCAGRQAEQAPVGAHPASRRTLTKAAHQRGHQHWRQGGAGWEGGVREEAARQRQVQAETPTTAQLLPSRGPPPATPVPLARLPAPTREPWAALPRSDGGLQTCRGVVAQGAKV